MSNDIDVSAVQVTIIDGTPGGSEQTDAERIEQLEATIAVLLEGQS